MKKTIKKLPLWFKTFLILVFVGSGWFIYQRKVKGSQAPAPSYQTGTAEKGTLIASLSVSGSVTATNSRTVTTTASGVVNKVYVKEGQKVTTGTPILQIDLDLNGRQKLQSAYASYQSAQNNLKSAQNKLLDLQSSLVNAKNIFDNQWAGKSPDDPTYIQRHNDYLSAQASLDNQQNVIKQAQASLESARLAYQLASSIVYAPISGTISAISLTPGMILNPTSDSANSSNSENKIAIVKTGSTPTISVSLTEIDVPKVSVGDKATITLDAFPDKTFTGKVIAVDTSGSVSSGVVSYPTTIQLDTNEEKILSNMSATVNIITDLRSDVLKIPSSALQNQSGEYFVRVIENGTLHNLPVQIGLQSDSETEIISGLSLGREIVISVLNAATTTSGSRSGTSVFGSFGGGGAIRMMR
jgi:RND family efflux transporter MFP subunit